MDYLAPMSNNLAFCLSIEKLLDLEIPDRAQVVRVILTELTRLKSHLVWIGTHAIDMGAMSMLLYAFREREMITGIYELVSGQRMMSSYFRVGGLAEDIPPDFEGRVKEILRVLPSRIDDYEGLLSQNPIWRQRTHGVGAVDADTAIDLGLTGPSLRACGVGYDCRTASPYTGYDRYQFDVPVETDGDVWSRYRVRMNEMRQSLRIIGQAIDDIPDGEFVVRKRGVTPPPKSAVVTETTSSGSARGSMCRAATRTCPSNHPRERWAFTSYPTAACNRTAPSAGHPVSSISRRCPNSSRVV